MSEGGDVGKHSKDCPDAHLHMKLREIVLSMLEANSGLQIRSGVYLEFIERECILDDVFKGKEFVRWVKNSLDIETDKEAVNLGALLMAHGYIYPPEDGVIAFLNDSSLYSVQCEKYWPPNLGNFPAPTEEQYQAFLSNMRKMLRLPKKKKAKEHPTPRAHKKLFFLGRSKSVQERASASASTSSKDEDSEATSSNILDGFQDAGYFKLYFPPPGFGHRAREQNILKMRESSKAEQLEFLQDSTISYLRRELYILKHHPHGLRHEVMSVTCKRILSYQEQRLQLDPQCASVYNPWCHDLDLLAFSSTPLEMAYRWRLSFAELMKDEQGRSLFKSFVESERSVENLNFWTSCQEFKFGPINELERRADEIINTFINSDSDSAVYISSGCKEKILGNLKYLDRFCFDEAEKDIFQLMKTDSYPRFYNWDGFKRFLEAKKQESERNIRDDFI